MKFSCTLGSAGLALVLAIGSLQAQETPPAVSSTVQQANWGNRNGQSCAPQVIVPAPCPQPYTYPSPIPGSGMPAGSGSGSGSAAGSGSAQNPQNPQNMPQNSDALNSAQEAGSNVAQSASPTMFGDFFSSSRGIIGAFSPYTAKIADNESVRPVDRVYFDYNYYNTLGGTGSLSPGTRIDGHVETIGFEKTFLNGDASIGLRLPFFQFTGDDFHDSQVGDLSVIFKYVVSCDSCTGNMVSAGIVFTTPTGPSVEDGTGGTVNPLIIQPYIGYIVNFGDFFVHGFESILIPTQSEDVLLMCDDIGLGWYMYRCECDDRMLRAFIPTMELHYNTPLTHRYPSTNDIAFPDDVNLTFGGTAVFDNNSTLGLAIAFPVTGPRPFDFEALVQFNWKF
jgi:hypothetical protein